MARALVVFADGFEEIELITIVDVLRRGGVDVTTAGAGGARPHVGAHQVAVTPDVALDAAHGTFDVIVLPGGAPNAKALAADARVTRLLRDQHAAGRAVAAICAAPQALDAAGLLSAGAWTCYPGWEGKLHAKGRRHDAVVDAGSVITSQGPATALAFALHLVGRFAGASTRDEVADGLLADGPR